MLIFSVDVREDPGIQEQLSTPMNSSYIELHIIVNITLATSGVAVFDNSDVTADKLASGKRYNNSVNTISYLETTTSKPFSRLSAPNTPLQGLRR